MVNKKQIRELLEEQLITEEERTIYVDSGPAKVIFETAMELNVIKYNRKEQEFVVNFFPEEIDIVIDYVYEYASVRDIMEQ